MRITILLFILFTFSSTFYPSNLEGDKKRQRIKDNIYMYMLDNIKPLKMTQASINNSQTSPTVKNTSLSGDSVLEYMKYKFKSLDSITMVSNSESLDIIPLLFTKSFNTQEEFLNFLDTLNSSASQKDIYREVKKRFQSLQTKAPNDTDYEIWKYTYQVTRPFFGETDRVFYYLTDLNQNIIGTIDHWDFKEAEEGLAPTIPKTLIYESLIIVYRDHVSFNVWVNYFPF